MHFDLVDLRLFANIADCNSLTRGAERSHLSLSAASVRVKNLEEALGSRLLYRNSSGVTLTTPGESLARHARTVLRQLQQLQGELRSYSQGIKGHLRVHANTAAITEYLPPVLREYLRLHPDISVELRERLSGEIVRAVEDGSIDIGIVSGNLRLQGVRALPYRVDHVVLVTPDGHRFADHAQIRFEETLDEDVVSLHDGSAMHQYLLKAAQGLGRELKLRIQVDGFEASCRMIEAGVGIGYLPGSVASRYVRAMAIRCVPLCDDWAVRQMHVCVRDFDSLPSFAAELVTLLRLDAQAAGSRDRAPNGAGTDGGAGACDAPGAGLRADSEAPRAASRGPRSTTPSA
jgi:DNA-binding transcriptional LysR family regulator